MGYLRLKQAKLAKKEGCINSLDEPLQRASSGARHPITIRLRWFIGELHECEGDLPSAPGGLGACRGTLYPLAVRCRETIARVKDKLS
jgi:hypothetical protein